MLGAETISIEIGGEAFELRPSLRACTCLVRRHGLPAIYAAAQDFNLSIVLDLLKGASISPALLLADIECNGVRKVHHRLADPLTRFALAIAGIDPDDATPRIATSGKPVTFDHYHSELFKIATGWLGWTPEQAWSATPAEIIAAKEGRTAIITDILGAIFGTADDAQPNTEPHGYSAERLSEIEQSGFDPAFDRTAFAALKQKINA